MAWPKQWNPPPKHGGWPPPPSRSPSRRASGGRPYTVCDCGQWKYNDKISHGEACACGTSRGGTGPHKRDSKAGGTEAAAGDADADQLAAALRVILRIVGTDKPDEVFTQLQKKCPEAFIAAAEEANRGPEPVTLAAARKAFTDATRAFRELVAKKEQLSNKIIAHTKQLGLFQAELDDTVGKLAEAKDDQAVCATAFALARQAQGGDEVLGAAGKQAEANRQGAEESDLDEDNLMDLEEEPTALETEALLKLQKDLGPDKKKELDDFILVSAKRRQKDLSKATPAEAMEAGAATAALVVAAAKARKETAAKAAAAGEKDKQQGA